MGTQKGSSDCGLYAITMMTSITNNDDTINLVYNQQELRIHLRQCFENGVILISKARCIKKEYQKN